jgi:pimeloyl-ACP methyl ester carboxylesterase
MIPIIADESPICYDLPMKTTILIVLSILLLSSCASQPKIVKEVERNGSFFFAVQSPSVLKNKVGYTATQMITVYLPPDYQSTKKKYPVIYYLHGFGGSSLEILEGFENLFDSWFKEHPDRQCIVAGVDGENAFGGSFFVNSPLSGNWEDFVAKEAVSFVDSRFRTLAQRQSRAISGFSMGGFGAIYNALRHPDVYSVLYTASPGLFDESGLKDAMKTWGGNSRFLESYGSVFGYDPALPQPHYRIPKFDGTAEDASVQRTWESGFGNLKEKLKDYLSLKDRLSFINLVYGRVDGFSWIPRGTEYFAKLLAEADIPCRLFVHEGGHEFNTPDVITTDLLPSVTSQLAY